MQRRIDSKRNTSSLGIVERIEYDPNRSSRIALVRWGVLRPPEEREEAPSLFLASAPPRPVPHFSTSLASPGPLAQLRAGQRAKYPFMVRIKGTLGVSREGAVRPFQLPSPPAKDKRGLSWVSGVRKRFPFGGAFSDLLRSPLRIFGADGDPAPQPPEKEENSTTHDAQQLGPFPTPAPHQGVGPREIASDIGEPERLLSGHCAHNASPGSHRGKRRAGPNIFGKAWRFPELRGKNAFSRSEGRGWRTHSVLWAQKIERFALESFWQRKGRIFEPLHSFEGPEADQRPLDEVCKVDRTPFV